MWNVQVVLTDYDVSTWNFPTVSEILNDAISGCPGGTAAAVPPPFRPSDPALCGSCPLVTPYYCRLGDLLC